jgi:hypothetical protein
MRVLQILGLAVLAILAQVVLLAPLVLLGLPVLQALLVLLGLQVVLVALVLRGLQGRPAKVTPAPTVQGTQVRAAIRGKDMVRVGRKPKGEKR